MKMMTRHEGLVDQVKYALECIKWMEAAPMSLLGTYVLDRAWLHIAEIVDGALREMGEERDEDGAFLCYDEEGGPKKVLEEWLRENEGGPK